MTEISIKPEGEPKQEGVAFPNELRHGTKVDIGQLLKSPSWRKHSEEEIEKEKGELRGTAERLQLDYKKLEGAFYVGELEELSDADWSRMENTHSSEYERGFRETEWTKEEVVEEIGESRDHQNIFQGLENGGELPAPIVLFRNDNPPLCIGGNTRLMACKALGIRPQILAVRI